MQKIDTPRKASPASRAMRDCCIDEPCDSGLRNQYFEGKRLTADSFRVEQSYLVERRRLLNRAMHGWGVIYGYPLKPAKNASTQDASGWLEIGAGLALDECGRELLQTGPLLLAVEDVILLDRKGARIERPPEGSFAARATPTQPPPRPRPPACWLLSVHYAERSEGPIRVNDPCSCERHEWDRVCETVRFSLRMVDCAECCASLDCELQCGCCTGPCCEAHVGDYAREGGGHDQPGAARRVQSNPVHRGGCSCLCEHLTGLSDAGCSGLCEIEEPCAHIRADLHHGVPLACVQLREGERNDWVFDSGIEACGPRRLVKRNDALFDLIRGCDLTRISAIGWAPWHRSKTPVKWDDFKASFGAENPAGSGRSVTTYSVNFSRPVRDDTVGTDCFAITITVEEEEGGWGVQWRVPIIDVVKSAAPGTPAGFVTRAVLVVDRGWVNDALESRKTIFNFEPALIEIEIRGDFIVDCNGQTVDANAIGLSPAPSGNGTPGGSFLSSFQVQARDPRPRLAASDIATQGVEP